MRFASLLPNNLTHASIKYTCQQYVPFTLAMACRTLSSTAFACSVCSGELSEFKVQYHSGA